MITYTPGEVPHREMHQILLSGVAPRPIALVATANREGGCNLAPYSFFNAYASKPPVLAIGPAVSSLTGRNKDTFVNLMETGECTINIVTYTMAHQINLASFEFDYGVDEFEKSGLGKRASSLVRVPMVAESPFSMECVLLQHIPLGRDVGGNGNILLVEAKKIHVSPDVLTDGRIDPAKMNQIARLGYDWYSRVLPESLFQLTKPKKLCIGYDALPQALKESTTLTAGELSIFAQLPERPSPEPGHFDTASASDDNPHKYELDELYKQVRHLLQSSPDEIKTEKPRHEYAKAFLRYGDFISAWAIASFE